MDGRAGYGTGGRAGYGTDGRTGYGTYGRQGTELSDGPVRNGRTDGQNKERMDG